MIYPHKKARDLNAKNHLDILDKIGPLIPRKKLKFWLDLPMKMKHWLI